MQQNKKRRKKPMRGKFIVIDGGEGTGTSTMAAFISGVFGQKFIRTREPGGAPFAEKIRGLILDPQAKKTTPEVLFELFWAARCDHVDKTIAPALRSGIHVVSDRFDSSTWAYQIGADGHDHLIDMFKAKRALYLATQYAIPDHYIILDGDPRICLPRAKKRQLAAGEALTHFDERDLAYHDKVRQGFLDFAGRHSASIVNAEWSLESVQAQVLHIVQQVIGGA